MGLVKRWREWKKLQKQEMQVAGLAVGINSTVDYTEDRHIIMLDYDVGDDLEKVRESVRELQQFWRLSDADIFQTTHGFHVFFWYDHVPYDRLKMIIAYAKDVDPMFKYISRFYDHKTIRVAGKYAERDIFFRETMDGIKYPTPYERSIGNMKKEEHARMIGDQSSQNRSRKAPSKTSTKSTA